MQHLDKVFEDSWPLFSSFGLIMYVEWSTFVFFHFCWAIFCTTFFFRFDLCELFKILLYGSFSFYGFLFFNPLPFLLFYTLGFAAFTI